MIIRGVIIILFFFLGPFRIIAQEVINIPEDRLVIADISITGNKVTHEKILLRELVFSKGDTIRKMELIPAIQRSRENLLNLSLFNFVSMDAEHLPGNQIIVIIDVQERWYIWPTPIFEHGERNLTTFLRNPKWDRLNYGLWLKWNNFRGRNEFLNTKIRLGYKEQYMLQYQKPNIGKNQSHTISGSYSFTRQHRVFYNTLENKPLYFENEREYLNKQHDAYLAYFFRPGLYSMHRVRIHYINDWVGDTISSLNPGYFGPGITRQEFFKLNYVYLNDKRDSKIYPLKGYAYKLKFQRVGLGLIKDFEFKNWEAEAVFFAHWQLAQRIYLANVFKGKVNSSNELPLHMKTAFGYSENLTGYDHYVINGKDYFINKLILKYQLIKPRSYSLPWFNFEQFTRIHYALYINLMGDIGYANNPIVTDPLNKMENSFQYSAGIGIDLVTYYDKILGVDFAVNRYGMTGFFFHVTTPFFEW